MSKKPSRKPVPWKVLSTRQTYKDQWISVRTDEVETGSGLIMPDFHIVVYRDWVNILPITDDGKVIAIKEYRHGAETITIGLPAGSSEVGESDYQAVAKRELMEETGFSASEWVSLGKAYSNWAMQNNQVHFFLALGAEKTGVQKLDPTEEIEVIEMPYEDYLNFEGVEPQHCHHAAMLHYAERFFARNPNKRPV